MRERLLTILVTLSAVAVYSQKKMAITIDDVPNVWIAKRSLPSKLLTRLDSLHVPIAIFINERNLDVSGSPGLLADWIKRDYVTPGNHAYSHPSYSTIGLDSFSADVLKGERLTRPLALAQKKDLRFFRFPYNDLGKDSIGHAAINRFLKKHNYVSTPFTLEGEDWMFATLYSHYLKDGNAVEAKRVAMTYIRHTLELLDYLERVSVNRYRRPIHQIYLCHDNQLNADYLPLLVSKLKETGYSFTSLDDALTDAAYKSTDYYQGKAGFSWIYRWIKDPEERKRLMRGEPDNRQAEIEYEKLNGK